MKSFRRRIIREYNDLRYRYMRYRSRFAHNFETFSKVLGGIVFLASILCIVALIVLTGFDHRPSDVRMLLKLVTAAQIIFLVRVIYNLTFCFGEMRRTTRFFKWIGDIAILLTLPSLLYPHPDHPWIPVLEQLLYNKKIICSIVGIYAVIELCYGIIRMLNRRINPTFLLATSFMFFIIVGSFILMMPRCTFGGISYINALFISTSAVCITGLTPIDVATQMTPFGILVLSVLIQIGGLGVMTFTSFFALFFSGNTSVYSQLIVKDMIYSKTINALLPTLLYILVFTLTIEALGAVAIFLSIHGTLGMSTDDEMIFSAFHSLSAFCNAGFSNIEGGLSNPMLLRHNQSVYLIASSLIFAGGIGYPILVNMRSAFFSYCRRFMDSLRHRRPTSRQIHIFDMNTRIVMTATISIFAVSALLFFIFEYNNSLAGMSLSDKIVQSVFNSFVPRSSGFSSVSPGGFLNITLIMMVVLMWIGGASQSTAGGVKVNTVALIILQVKAVMKGRTNVVVFHRTVASDSMRRANAVVTISIVAYVAYSMVLVALEPALPVKSLLYESASALFTVGSSLGVTPLLATPAKVLLCTAMFLGRVGILSLLTGFADQRGDLSVGHPVDNVIIN